MAEKPHRHRWKPLTELHSPIGNTYAWFGCECGVRKVVTLVGGKIAGRRMVRPQKRDRA